MTSRIKIGPFAKIDDILKAINWLSENCQKRYWVTTIGDFKKNLKGESTFSEGRFLVIDFAEEKDAMLCSLAYGGVQNARA